MAMPSRLTEAALRLACAHHRLRDLAGHGPRTRAVLIAAEELVRAAAELQAAVAVAGVTEMDPIQAVALVLDAAIAAGADWQQVVATVNHAGTMRT